MARAAQNVDPTPRGETGSPTPPPKVENDDISNREGAFGAVAPEEPPGEAEADEPMVEYKGRATTRRVTRGEWKRAGVEDQDTVEFSRRNNFKVAKSRLNDEALELLRNDGGFKVPRKSSS